MKVKTSITLDDEVLQRIDSVLADHETRSAFFQYAATQLATQRERDRRDARDLEILNSKATLLNEEALENLSLVADVFSEQGLEQP